MARHNDRRCIATGAALGPGDPAIRFVLSPDGTVVADLARKLPGRGAWTIASRGAVLTAAKKGLFSRAFRAKAALPQGEGADAFADRLGDDLADRALNALGLARRAGHLVIGYEKTRSALQKGDASVYIHASDAAPDGVSRLLPLAGERVRSVSLFPGDILDRALGEANIVHLALTHAGMGRRFADEAALYAAYLAEDGSTPTRG